MMRKFILSILIVSILSGIVLGLNGMAYSNCGQSDMEMPMCQHCASDANCQMSCQTDQSATEAEVVITDSKPRFLYTITPDSGLETSSPLSEYKFDRPDPDISSSSETLRLLKPIRLLC